MVNYSEWPAEAVQDLQEVLDSVKERYYAGDVRWRLPIKHAVDRSRGRLKKLYSKLYLSTLGLEYDQIVYGLEQKYD